MTTSVEHLEKHIVLRRRAFAGIFVIGVLLATAFGCMLAGYDIWGGIPRELWRTAGGLLAGAFICVTIGIIGWVHSWPKHARGRALLRAAVFLLGVGALSGAALWMHYVSRWKTSRLICAPALVATSRAAREAALREGLGPLFPVIDPHGTCLELERDRRKLEASGTCPMFLMDDVPCRCGNEIWQPGRTPKCTTQPTTCESHDTTENTIGCVGTYGKLTLDQARRAEVELGAR